MVLGSVIFLFLDSLGNTILYTGDSDFDDWGWKCALTIIIQQVFFAAVILMIYLRMYRIYKVCSSYKEYLKD